MRLSDSMYCMS